MSLQLKSISIFLLMLHVIYIFALFHVSPLFSSPLGMWFRVNCSSFPLVRKRPLGQLHLPFFFFPFLLLPPLPPLFCPLNKEVETVLNQSWNRFSSAGTLLLFLCLWLRAISTTSTMYYAWVICRYGGKLKAPILDSSLPVWHHASFGKTAKWTVKDL